MSDQEGGKSPEDFDEEQDEEDVSGGSDQSDQLEGEPAPSRWGHFDDENDEVNETFHTLIEDFVVEKNAQNEDPGVEDKYLQDHWEDLMKYIADRAGEFEPVVAGIALRLARKGQYGPEDEGKIPKPPLIPGYPETLRLKALQDTEFSLAELKKAGSEEESAWENVELRQACLEMQLHLFSNGQKPAPADFDSKMKAFLDQREAEARAEDAESDASEDDDNERKRPRDGEDDEEDDPKKAKN
eukprot:RCo005260